MTGKNGVSMGIYPYHGRGLYQISLSIFLPASLTHHNPCSYHVENLQRSWLLNQQRDLQEGCLLPTHLSLSEKRKIIDLGGDADLHSCRKDDHPRNTWMMRVVDNAISSPVCLLAICGHTQENAQDISCRADELKPRATHGGQEL